MNLHKYKVKLLKYVHIIKSDKFQVAFRVFGIVILISFICFLFYVNVKKYGYINEADIDVKLDNLRIESTEENTIVGTPSVIKYFEDKGIILVFNGISVSPYDIERDGLSFKVGDDVIDVYEYDGTKKAKEEVSSISKRFDSRKIKGEVHFYRLNNLIVAYEGSSNTITTLLQKAFGPQFAGE